MEHKRIIDLNTESQDHGYFELKPPIEARAGDMIEIFLQGPGEAMEKAAFRFAASYVGQVTGLFIPKPPPMPEG